MEMPVGFWGEPCLAFLPEQKIVASLGRIATDVDQFVGRAVEDVAGEGVVRLGRKRVFTLRIAEPDSTRWQAM